MRALNKLELAQTLCQDLELEMKIAKVFVEDFFSILHETLQAGLNVQLSGFGQFTVRHKAKRMGHNLKTMRPVEITARRVVTFKAGKQLKDSLSKM